MTIPEKTGVFRQDINGLRAFAVIAVVFYHFGIAGFPGGFIGVDVFFVISGFLMTGIIIRSLRDEQFSLGRFYLARARRILPALIVLCVILLIAGWFFLLPEEYSDLGKHIRDSLLFRSNNTYVKEAGYFDVASHEKWVLHTWTLSIEWQFYLLLPLLLLVVWKLRPGWRYAVYILVFLFVFSLVVSILKTPDNPAKYFYLLRSRIWEMAAGGLVFLLADKITLIAWQRHAAELAGMAIIIASVIVFNSSSLWPGWRALMPVTGTVFVLLAANAHSLWTGNFIAQWLGTRSYSIYLWHWPIVVMLVYKEKLHQSEWVIGGLILILLLSYLSYQFVEAPARKKLAGLNSWLAAALLLLAVLVLIVPAQIIRHNGFPERLPVEVITIAAEAKNRNPRVDECFVYSGTDFPSCIFGGEQIKAIFIGDSHANSTITALASSLNNPNAGVLFWGYTRCPTLFGVKNIPEFSNEDQYCDKFNTWVLEELNNRHKDIPVILLSRTTAYAYGGNELWSNDRHKPLIYFSKIYEKPEPEFLAEFRQHYIDTVCLIAKDRPVYLVRPIPEMEVNVAQSMARSWMFGDKKEVSISLVQYKKRHAFIWAVQDEIAEQCNVRILDPIPYLCDNEQCFGSKNNRPLYYDAHHLTEYGNRFLIPMFSQAFNK